MSIAFTQPTKSRDLVSAATNATFLVAEMLIASTPGDYVKLAPRTYSYAKKISDDLRSKPSSTPQNIAWSWLALVVAEATSQFLSELHDNGALNVANVKAGIANHIEKSLDLSTNAKFDAHILTVPADHPAFSPTRKNVQELIHEVSLLVTYDLGEWQAKYDQCLRRAIGFVTAFKNDEFRTLVDYVSGYASQAGQQDLDWTRHAQWIHHTFNEAPVFSTDGGITTPLASLYVKLRCYWHSRAFVANENGEPESPKMQVHIGDLHTVMESWLDAESADQIKVIAGGPGSGKSSFAKAFASEVACRNDHKVVFVELQRMQLTGNLRIDLAEYFRSRHQRGGKNGSAGFSNSPLDWVKSTGERLLLIFDGLDELTHDDEVSKSKSREFILQVRNLVSDERGDGSKLKALLLGRNLSCQDGIKAAALPLETMLHVAPMRSLAEEDFLPGDMVDLVRQPESVVFHTIPDYTKDDQRLVYWRKWTASTGAPTMSPPEAITHPDLKDLNVEPLLLHLLILSDFIGDRWVEAADNRNLVYEDILRKIHFRNKEKRNANRTLEVDDFMLLMECLGLTAWRGNGRAGTEESFNAIREVHARHRRKALADQDALTMDSIVLQTHARRVDGDRPGFEFIHKSFGEYLAGRGLISLALRCSNKMSRTEDPQDERLVAQDWAQVIKGAELTKEVMRFLQDEARRRFKPELYGTAKSHLEQLYSWVSANGFPIQTEVGGTFRELESWQRCGEASLLAVGAAIACSLNEPLSSVDKIERLKVGWAEEPIDYYLNRIGATRGSAVTLGLDCLDLTGRSLVYVHLPRARLRGVSFAGGFFMGANLYGADLSFADLNGVRFFWSRLEESRLFGADLRNTRFGPGRGSSLTHANLAFADLRNAEFRGMNLSYVEFNSAKMQGTHFIQVNLNGASFEGVDLADCRLSRCSVWGTNFANATSRLATKQLSQLFGVKSGFGKTVLPDGVDPPAFWIDAPDGPIESDEGIGNLLNDFTRQYRRWLAEFPRLSSQPGIDGEIVEDDRA
jgi:uncharacterized protein YjbI with pentapeptide repeats